nr:MAG TPA: hypothetical protein [Caudoviricetes sp.]
MGLSSRRDGRSAPSASGSGPGFNCTKRSRNYINKGAGGNRSNTNCNQRSDKLRRDCYYSCHSATKVGQG